MVNFFGHSDDDSPTQTPKEAFVRNLNYDIDNWPSLGQIESNHELSDALNHAIANGEVDDKCDANFNIEQQEKMDKYRTADGSNNNINLLALGQAEFYYALLVPPKHIPTNLPDPEDLFDILLARTTEPKAHPTKISSLLFALASIVNHDLFHASDKNKEVAATSSYLNLSSLYGCDQESQHSVRTMVDRKLKTDTFADVRFINQPPNFAALLVCFCRFHNSITIQLAAINDNGQFTRPPQSTSSERLAYKGLPAQRDEDLFQTARVVACGLYVQIVQNDFIRTILNINE